MPLTNTDLHDLQLMTTTGSEVDQLITEVLEHRECAATDLKLVDAPDTSTLPWVRCTGEASEKLGWLNLAQIAYYDGELVYMLGNLGAVRIIESERAAFEAALEAWIHDKAAERQGY